jgi:5-aminopentanamidase
MPPIYGDVDKSVEEIRRALAWAEDERIDVLCLPECFLTGYFRKPARAARNSIDLDSARFDAILAELAGFESTLILGLIERTETGLFNSAVIIERGELVGRYRKQHLVEAAFEPGDGAPIFARNGIRFGVNICFDANFPEAARDLAERGVALIFYPLNNSLPWLVARRWRHRHLRNLIDRARDSSVWVVSSDVVERSALRRGYGCTAIVDPTGTVVERCPELEAGRVKSQLTVPVLTSVKSA